MNITRRTATIAGLSLLTGTALSLAVLFQAQGEDRIKHTDLMVPHNSTVPANVNEPVQLIVRERDGTPPGAPPDRRRAVLMLHGRSVPALAGFDLDYRQYNWAADLAQKGFDVFVMDLQGSGRSPRPKMDDPCNANPALQGVLIPNPLSAPCSASYQFQLNNSKSDWEGEQAHDPLRGADSDAHEQPSHLIRLPDEHRHQKRLQKLLG